MAAEPTRMSRLERLRAADTCCALPSGVHGTRYLPPNRRPRAFVTLASVSPVELRASRAGADRVFPPQGSASHLARLAPFCTPLLLTPGFEARGHKDESHTRIDLARDRGWHRLPGRVHASPTGLLQEVGGLPRGAGRRLCTPRCAEEPGWVWVPRGRVEREGLGPCARVGCGGAGQGLGEAFVGERGPGFPEGERTRHSQESEQGALPCVPRFPAQLGLCSVPLLCAGPNADGARAKNRRVPATHGAAESAAEPFCPDPGGTRGEAKASL